MIHRHGLFWFGNDLRLHDNAALLHASEMSIQLACVYCVDSRWFKSDQYGTRSMGSHRWRFLWQSLRALDKSLQRLGQSLNVVFGDPVTVLCDLIERHDIDAIILSETPGVYERRAIERIQTMFPTLHIGEVPTHTLFTRDQLVLPKGFPRTFSKFRKVMEEIEVAAPLESPRRLANTLKIDIGQQNLPEVNTSISSPFHGGENKALDHLQSYFSDKTASRYKETRNCLEGWKNSTKFSPWLANGNLSARQILNTLKDYEASHGANDSTYWIHFELLWREYFQWYAHHFGSRVFRFTGIGDRKPLTSFYPQRFQSWARGTTSWPLVNACMRELNTTGYMSNRGRQLVASCLVNELGVDWRCGAAYFEQQLIDYDVAANWGNWQYIAGVGADPRGGRHFNLAKQQEIYDPNGEYVSRWANDVVAEPMDYCDAADWPIGHD